MPIAFDLHTHTTMSGHAYSSLEECAAGAASAGLHGFAVTDHAPAMVGAPCIHYFLNQSVLPRRIHGVLVLRGAEANIMDFEGGIDLPERALKRLDICIASFHDICRPAGTEAGHTAAWEAIVQNPLIDILGHPGRGDYPFDVEHVVRMCRRHDKLVEINNHTLDRKSNHDDCLEIARACLRHGVSVVLSSDAHYSAHIGRVSRAEALLAEIGFPEALILNRSRARVLDWLKAHKPHFASEYASPEFIEA